MLSVGCDGGSIFQARADGRTKRTLLCAWMWRRLSCEHRSGTAHAILGGRRGSGRRLNGLQKAQDPREVFLLEDLLPRRHALGGPSLADGLVEHRRHALAVADAQASQIASRLGTVRVRRVAVRAVLVEHGPAG